MDLTTITEKVAGGAYRTVKEFVADLRLVFTNCIEYWTATAEYAITAQYLLNEVDLRVKEMTFELTTGTQVVHTAGDAAGGSKAKGSKKAGKQHKNAAVAAWTPAMQQAAAAAAVATTAPPTPSTPGTPMTPSVDFPTHPQFATVMSAADHSKCTALVHSLQSDPQYGLFAKPANIPEFAALLSDYYVKVRRPNDLQTVSRRLAIRDYATLDEFKADVALIWENAASYYSRPGLNEQLLDADDICKLALRLKEDFNRRWDTYEQTAANRLANKKSKAALPTVATTAAAAAAAQAASAAHPYAVQVKSEHAAAEATDSATRRLTTTGGAELSRCCHQRCRCSHSHQTRESSERSQRGVLGRCFDDSPDYQHFSRGGRQ